MPKRKGVREGILRGLYLYQRSKARAPKLRAQLLGSGAILNEALKAQQMLNEDFGVAADVWSVTSFKALHEDALECERWNMLNPDEDAKTPYVAECLNSTVGPLVFATDYVKALPASLGPWLTKTVVPLGTNGFGRSEDRESLRDFFEVDARFITLSTLAALAREGKLKPSVVTGAIEKLGIDTDKLNPLIS